MGGDGDAGSPGTVIPPCQSRMFIQIWNHEQRKFQPQLFSQALYRLWILFGFTELFKSIMMHAKLYLEYTKKGHKNYHKS